jgi:hypothetical protein
LQTKRVNTQIQLNNQKTQNIVSGIGGWVVIVPFIFIDATTSKNESYNSYAEREEYLRKLAADKNCTDLPKPYEFPSTTKQTSFIPSGGNVKKRWRFSEIYQAHKSNRRRLQGMGDFR